MTEPATVTTRAPDGTVETAECWPDSYVVVVGPRMYVASEQVYANGTIVVTLKREPASQQTEEER